MARTTQPKIKILHKDFGKKAEAILARIQSELPPEKAEMIVSINVSTGEYVLADTLRESGRAFRERWPDEIAYTVRADGGPVPTSPWSHGRRGSFVVVPRSNAKGTKMGKAQPKLKIFPKDFDKKAKAILARIQPELLPDKADQIVSINVTTGEYVLADTLREATRKFRERWPDELFYQVRADGGPVEKLSWV